MKYKIITEELMKNLIDFLDEVQFDAASENTPEDMQKVNFCNWAIQELLNSYDGIIKYKGSNKYPKKPNKKSRDQYVDETFLDWNLPEMTDKEYEKLVDQFDAFLRGWEKEYNKKNKKKKPKKRDGDDWKPRIEDVAQHCSLDEIRDMLLDDPELTDHERFELYYEEHERVNRKKVKTYTLDQMLKGTKIQRYKSPPKKSNNK